MSDSSNVQPSATRLSVPALSIPSVTEALRTDRSPYDLVKRIHEVTDMNMFLFHSFSDLNVFRILRLQDRLYAIDDKLRAAHKTHNCELMWTKNEDDDLDNCLKKYCILIPTSSSLC
jgi:hypothetical protein